MASLCLLVFIPFLLVAQDEEVSSRIPPAFPTGTSVSTGSNTDEPGRYPEEFPTGKPRYPEVKSYTPPSRQAPGSAHWLLRRMAETDSPDLRMRASEAWPVSETDARGMREIIHHLNDPSSKVRTGAQQRLSTQDNALVFSYVMRTMVGGTITDVKSLDTALPYLGNTIGSYMLETLRTGLETPQHRRIAAYCLGRMGVHAASEDLAANLWADDAVLARTCLDALASLLPPGSVPHWIKLLDHPDPYFKTRAVHALAGMYSHKSFDTLRQIALGQAYPELAGEVLRGIRGYPPEILYPLLVEIMEQNKTLRSSALRILRARTQMDLGTRPGPWREWLTRAAAAPPPPLVPSP